MKFNLTNIAAPRILGGIVCLYFLIIYSISVARDQQYRRRVIDDAVYKSTMAIGKNIAESQKDTDIGEDEKLDVFVDSTTSLKEAQELLNVYNRFVTLQLIFEILFPTLLAIYAIIVSLIYPLYLLYMK